MSDVTFSSHDSHTLTIHKHSRRSVHNRTGGTSAHMKTILLYENNEKLKCDFFNAFCRDFFEMQTYRPPVCLIIMT